MTFYPNGQSYQPTVSSGSPATVSLSSYDPVTTVVRIQGGPIEVHWTGEIYSISDNQPEYIKPPAGLTTLTLVSVNGFGGTVYLNFGQEI